MKVLLAIVGVVVLLVVVLGFSGCNTYNSLVNSSQGVDRQWAQVQNVYQRRADLIPNLVNTVQGSANFEKSTLTAVVQARASATGVTIDPNSAPTDPAKLQQFEQAQAQLGQALSRLLVVVEKYPDIKSTSNFAGLQAELAGTENRIAVERGRFNEAVQDYNTRVKRFPAVLFAGMMGFSPKPYFTATPQAQTPPTVQFDFNTGGGAGSPARTPATVPQ